MKKTISIFISVLLSNFMFTQSINLNPANTKAINSEQHGLSYVNFYNTCTDGVCIDNIVNLRPRIIRFPSAGDADNYSMNLDTMGYGINFSGVAKHLADRYNSLQNPLTTPPFTTYTAPIIFDPSSVPLNYNPSVFSNTNAAASYSNELITWYNNYRKQQTQTTSSYLLNFKQHIKQIEDSLQTGEKVNVIYVANIFSGTPTDLLKTIKQLVSNTITPVKVVGLEMSNESWGKKNADMFPDGDAFYYYVTGSPLYTGCLNLKGNYIDSVKSHFPNIKIGLPTAPLGVSDYYGCDMTSSNTASFTTWNTQLGARSNNTISVIVNNNPQTFKAFDAFVIHKYFDDKFWGNVQEGIGSCNNCLYNATGPNQFKNYLRAHTTTTVNPFNHSYAYFPSPDDDTLKSSFDCQLKETFTYVDSGFVNKFVGGYMTQLGITNSNNKKLWMTEWNILEDNNDDTTYLFHNTFNQAVLTMGWKMGMYRSNWKFPSATDLFQYSTFFNGVSEQQNGCVSKRTNTGNNGDGVSVDATSSDIKRMAYWPTYMMRHISLDSLKWVDNLTTNMVAYPNTRFYSFVNPSNNKLYIYYINANNTDMILKTDSIHATGYVLDTNGIYREGFAVKNNYSSAGFAEQFELNKYYKSGNNWLKPLNNEPYYNYGNTNVSTHNLVLQRKSMGLIKLKYNLVTGINKTSLPDHNFVVYPNPTNGSLIINSSHDELNTLVTVSDILGHEIKRDKLNGQSLNMDLSGLSNGVYLVNLISDNKTTTYKVILLK